MPSDFSLKAMNSAHRALQWVTRGRAGWNFGGMPVIELTTIGRRSGEARTTMLTSPLRDGDAYVVVASRGGDDRHPAWFLNLRANPNVDAVIERGPRTAMLARVATSEERARLWPIITNRYSNYAGYQTRTKREIPLVLLEPVHRTAVH
ncbi:nitroreductase/quinone reductase family protein [Parafrigoribacterium soli]|uniref:nitroreductase/quinone reductase family protein n=1 Tax=Parafrigoribacterium soli TaxID=3144663 RepID=UPI0032EC3379